MLDRIDLGRVGEYGARSVTFDLSDFARFGDGTFTLLHRRSEDFAPYVVRNIEVSGSSLKWNINADDTACAGTGMAEIQLHRGETLLAKSDTYHTFVDDALGIPDEPKAYDEITIDTVTALAVRAETAAAAADEARNQAETAASYTAHPPLVGGNGNWFLWNGTAYVDSGYPTRGEKGDDGPAGANGAPGNGILSIQKTSTTDLIDTYTIAFDNGLTTTFDVKNGDPGKMLDKNSGNELFGWIGTIDEYNELEHLDVDTFYWIKEPI